MSTELFLKTEIESDPISEAVDPAHPEPGPPSGPQRRVTVAAAAGRRNISRCRNISSGGGGGPSALGHPLCGRGGQDEVPAPRRPEDGGTEGITAKIV